MSAGSGDIFYLSTSSSVYRVNGSSGLILSSYSLTTLYPNATGYPKPYSMGVSYYKASMTPDDIMYMTFQRPNTTGLSLLKLDVSGSKMAGVWNRTMSAHWASMSPVLVDSTGTHRALVA